MILWVIFIIGMIAIPIMLGNKFLEKNKKSMKVDYRARFNPEFYGGFKEVGICESCYVTVYDTYIEIQLWNDNKNKFYLEKIIEGKDIIDIRVKTQTQIQNEVSLGKLITFGVLAFAMKGNKNILADEYVVMKIKYEGEEINLIFRIPNEQMNFIQIINSIRE
ncbi:hypothetical protein FDA25_02400 [Clostridium botulinum]|nr:hypothetical protein [Clostridium botulinum]NFH71465.1 hypothetical protein [Clostridium botulinum]NFI79768.1 hypothetical protein [Clostridium botulinum]NFJ70923.1 hypothetical protein [Clostridium botulinum]NFM11222.1 hypothetical protein [Clostridium botulinum]